MKILILITVWALLPIYTNAQDVNDSPYVRAMSTIRSNHALWRYFDQSKPFHTGRTRISKMKQIHRAIAVYDSTYAVSGSCPCINELARDWAAQRGLVYSAHLHLEDSVENRVLAHSSLPSQYNPIMRRLSDTGRPEYQLYFSRLYPEVVPGRTLLFVEIVAASHDPNAPAWNPSRQPAGTRYGPGLTLALVFNEENKIVRICRRDAYYN